MVFSHFVVLLLIGLIVLSVAVGIYDFKYRLIPNAYLLSAVIFAVCIFFLMFVFLPAAGVARGFLFSLLGMLVGGLFLYPAYKLKQVGAGDVKLVMVFGLFLGMKGVILSILVGAIVGGVWALGLAYKYGGLLHMWHNMKFMARSVYLSGGKDLGWDLRSEGAIAMPYGVALSIGAILIALEQLNLHLNRMVELGLIPF